MQRISRRTMITGAAFLLSAIGSSIANAAEPKIVAGPMFTLVDQQVFVWLQANQEGDFEVHATGSKPNLGGCGNHSPLTKSFCTRQVPYVSFGECQDFRYAEAKLEIMFREKWGDSWKDIIKCDLPGPPEVGDKGQFTFAFGSCSHQEKYATKQPIWSAIAKEKPDCFLFIGDNMYMPSDPAEYPKTRDEVFKLYCDTYDRERQLPEMQALLRSTMSFALWDDHDYGPNNADRTWKWKDVALEAFKLYFPGEYGLPDAPGCFRKFSWGDIDVFMLDDRTFRDPNKDDNRKTIFGEKQLAWLKDGLAASKATFKLVVCGNQMLSDFHPHEGWGVQFRPERDAFLRWLWDAKIEGVIFLAGDRHFAEMTCKKDPRKIGPDLWELTSSPLANDSFKIGDKIPDGDRRASYVAGPNFGLLKFNTAATPPTVKLILKDEQGKTVFMKTLKR